MLTSCQLTFIEVYVKEISESARADNNILESLAVCITFAKLYKTKRCNANVKDL